jgi:mono/diheme cytochrome c family protein
MNFRAAIVLIFGAIGACAAVDYPRDIKPILAEHCYRCHGASQHKHGLRIDTAASALKGGENGPALLPGTPSGSLLIQVLKGTHTQISQMPYKKAPLKEAQIAAIEAWIREGAKAPADEAPETSKHWAFIAPERPAIPAVTQPTWARNAIDHFILARLDREPIQPSPPADSVTLVRRLYVDLTGLPPSPEEVAEFLNDLQPGAYERLVDRLLASPRFGERCGRLWLDVARYADSNGYSIDAPRSIWKYRDWVIQAINRDLPFDQFTIEQLAGDLLPNATIEQKIATGFSRQTQINQEGGIDPEQFRVESIIDRVNTTATAFLGLTVGCAQCHDHKFDPISQREYYQLFAFFNNTVEDGHGKSAPEGMLEVPGELEQMNNLDKELEEAEADLNRYLDTKGSELVKWEQSLTPEQLAKFKPDVRDSLNVSFAQRSVQQKRGLYAIFRPDDKEFKQRNANLTKLEKRQPKPVTTLVMVEQEKPRDSYIFIKGDFTRRGSPVTPGVLGVLHSFETNHAHHTQTARTLVDTATDDPVGAPTVPRLTRLDLANWIVDPANPLIARVTVNRIWQQYFGRGLVETENDFGTQGTPPIHPELLDWLATEFMARGWTLKAIHRLIVTSATYQQSSKARPDLANIDANNRLLARQSRLRLDAELVRDACLSASGLLCDRIGGPGVFPPQPAGVMTLGQVKREWKPNVSADRYRRGMYTFFWRATPHPALMVFDSPDAFSTCTRRVRSNTPLQALTILNDEAFYEFAQTLGQRMMTSSKLQAPSSKGAPTAKSQADAGIEYGFQLCLARMPTAEEQQRLSGLLNKQLANSSEAEAWTTVARVLLNLDEMITRE